MADLTTSSAVDTFMQAADQAAMRTALGLGTIATQAASAVAITGGSAALTGVLSTSANGAANAPAFTLTGTIYSGGTATTTKPIALIEPAGTTSTNWGTTGTYFGINAAAGFTADANSLMDFQVAGVRKARLTGAGVFYLTGVASNLFYDSAGVGLTMQYVAAYGTPMMQFQAGISLGTGGAVSVMQCGPVNGSTRFGVGAASGWTNQLIGAAGAIVGTTTNGSPTNTLTIHGSVSTGTGTGGNIIFGVYGTNGVSGTAIGTLNTVLTIVAARKVLNVTGIPTSSAGLSSGDVYSNAGILTIVP